MIDLLVIGAGVVGSWVGYEASRRGLATAILDKRVPGENGSGRIRTAVLHSGAYFEPGLEKTRHLIRGRQMSIDFARRYRVPHEVCGKLIVTGLNGSSHPRREIEIIYEKAREAGVEDLEIIESPGRVYPGVLGPYALHTATAAVIDVERYLSRIRKLAEDRGAVFLMGRKFISGGEGYALVAAEGENGAVEELHARKIVNAAGLESDLVAGSFGAMGYDIHVVRSEFLTLQHSLPFRKLIYPLPSIREDNSGIHYGFHPGDREAFAGPLNAPALDRNDCTMTAGPADILTPLARLIDGVDRNTPTTGFCGLHPRLYHNGQPVHDFIVEEKPSGVLHLPGIESPGFTSAPSIALEVVDWVMN